MYFFRATLLRAEHDCAEPKVRSSCNYFWVCGYSLFHVLVSVYDPRHLLQYNDNYISCPKLGPTIDQSRTHGWDYVLNFFSNGGWAGS